MPVYHLCMPYLSTHPPNQPPAYLCPAASIAPPLCAAVCLQNPPRAAGHMLESVQRGDSSPVRPIERSPPPRRRWPAPPPSGSAPSCHHSTTQHSADEDVKCSFHWTSLPTPTLHLPIIFHPSIPPTPTLASSPAEPVGNDGVHACLLQHDLADPGAVARGGQYGPGFQLVSPPWQQAPVLVIPPQQALSYCLVDAHMYTYMARIHVTDTCTHIYTPETGQAGHDTAHATDAHTDTL